MDEYQNNYNKLMEICKPKPSFYDCDCGSRLKMGTRSREGFQQHFGTNKHQAWLMTQTAQKKTEDIQ